MKIPIAPRNYLGNYFGQEKIKKNVIIFLITLMILSVLVRFHFFSVPMINDEGGYSYVAHFWSNSYQLYREIPFDRPQGIFILYKFILPVFGDEVENIRFSAAFFNAITLLALFFLTWKITSLKSAYASSVIYAIFSACPSIEGFTANSELFAILPLTISVNLTWNRKWSWVGVLSGIAFLLKPIGISGLMFAFIWMVYVKTKWKEFLKLISCFAIFPILSIIHGILIGWEHFWYSFVEQKLSSDTIFSINIETQLNLLTQSTIKTLPALIIPGVLAVFGLFLSNKNVRFFGISWILCSIFGMSLGGNWYWHYYVQLVPPLAFLSGIGLIKALKSPHRWRWELAIAIPVIVFGYAEVPYWFYSPADVSLNLYQRPSYLASADVASYVQSHTTKDESIYIAFSQAEIYYLSRRRAAIPQLYYYQVRGSKAILKTVLNGIQAKIPSLIVWCQSPPQWISKDSFQALIEEGYSEVKRFYLSRRLSDGTMYYGSSAIIYKRKE